LLGHNNLVDGIGSTSITQHSNIYGSNPPLTFLHIGGDYNSGYWKNTDTVVKGFIEADISDATLVVTRKDSLDLGIDLPPNVKIFDNKTYTREEIIDFYRSCDVVVCPSVAEGFGHNIFEGLMHGKPVITTNCAPMNELVTPERGFLVEGRSEGHRGLSEIRRCSVADMAAVYVSATRCTEDELLIRGRMAAHFTKSRIESFDLWGIISSLV
jgi:glycosyltransferase involved in cell wall biosynthesis